MSTNKYTKAEVMDICKRMGLTVTMENERGCTAKKEFAMYRFEYLTNDELAKRNKIDISECASKSEDTNESTVVETAKETVEVKPKRRGRPKGSKNKKKVDD